MKPSDALWPANGQNRKLRPETAGRTVKRSRAAVAFARRLGVANGDRSSKPPFGGCETNDEKPMHTSWSANERFSPNLKVGQEWTTARKPDWTHGLKADD